MKVFVLVREGSNSLMYDVKDGQMRHCRYKDKSVAKAEAASMNKVFKAAEGRRIVVKRANLAYVQKLDAAVRRTSPHCTAMKKAHDEVAAAAGEWLAKQPKVKKTPGWLATVRAS